MLISKKLEFDLKGTPLTTSDIVEVELKDYENIGANKLLIAIFIDFFRN